MEKSLHKMTPKELGKLFPVCILDYNDEWPKLFKKESRKIIKAAGKANVEKIYHIGSTSVKGLKSKPTIDILLEIKSGTDLKKLESSLIDTGYESTVHKENPPPHMVFYKGYTVNGFSGQCYHLHIRYKGIHDELIFRDYLKDKPELIKEYENLKLDLQDKYKYDRDGYTDAKTEFITKILNEAKKV